MKRLLTIFAVLSALSFSASAQTVFTLVYATSDDGFVNVRESPASKQYEDRGKYYVLTSAHDNLYIRKQDVKVIGK